VRFNLFTRRQALGIAFFAVAGYSLGFLLGAVNDEGGYVPIGMSSRGPAAAWIGLVFGVFAALGYLLLKSEK
jgi:hypothetical protein